MRLFKPTWVSHNGQPIFSIDIHPDGSRFATGGQGDGGSSGKVMIWNMTPVKNAEDEMNNEIPKVLCIMENHLACVNCVRWSCNGRYLASGGDDKLIMIWQFAGYGGAGTFGAGPPALKTSSGERWRCLHILKGHTGDVLDLAWSPGNQWLASCSIDNTVVIWNGEKFPETTAVLKGHASLVKGVTWDPIGSYIASQSDDKTVKIWKTLDWKLEMTVKKPFEECTATTHVLRLSWSPDGGYLVSAHAMNNSGPTAQIIERAGWKTEMDFVGHRKAITCTRFNGCVFSKPKSTPSNDETKSKTLPYTCCAVGSRDRSLSIWLTSLRRPLVVIHDLFENSVMDISWSFDGFSLLCCSWDGTVAFLDFEANEIGQTLTQEEKNKLLLDTYGKTSSIASQPLIIENPAMLAIQEKKNDQATTNGVTPGPATPVKYPTEQIETRTSTGRRRIIPIFVAPQEALGGIPRPFGSSSAFGKLSTNLLKSAEKLKGDSDSKMEVSPVKSSYESENSKASDNEKKLPKDTPSLPLNGQMSALTIADSNVEKIPKKPSPHKAMEETAQMKKKAVLDIRLCEQTKTAPEVNKQAEEKKSPATEPAISIKPVTKETNQPPGKSVTDESPSSMAPRKPGRPPLHLKRKQIEPAASPAKKKHRQIRKEHQRSFVASGNQVALHSAIEQPPAASIAKATPPPKISSPDILLPVKKLVRKITAQCPGSSDLSVIADNELHPNNEVIPSVLHKVFCQREKLQLWSNVFSAPVRLLHVSKFIVAAACADHLIHVLSLASGRRLLPPLCFGSSLAPVVQLHCRGRRVMAIDASCHLSIWDTKTSKVVVNNCSFANLVTDGNNREKNNSESSPLEQCSLTESGLALLTFQDHRSFTYNTDLCTWILISSPHDAVEQYSENVATGSSIDANATQHERDIFSSLSKKMNTGTGALASRSFHATPSAQRQATLALLETKVASCIMLQSVTEYRRWLLAYVRYLVQENLELRLREVCDDLIGPPSQRHGGVPGRNASWRSHVLGVQKRTLLQDDILPVIGSNLSFQRLYTEYQDQLDSVQSQHLPTWRKTIT